MDRNVPSSSANEITSTPLSELDERSACERATSSAPITPSAPSSQPPRGTLSLCEPSSTVRVAPGRRP